MLTISCLQFQRADWRVQGAVWVLRRKYSEVHNILSTIINRNENGKTVTHKIKLTFEFGDWK